MKKMIIFVALIAGMVNAIQAQVTLNGSQKGVYYQLYTLEKKNNKVVKVPITLNGSQKEVYYQLYTLEKKNNKVVKVPIGDTIKGTGNVISLQTATFVPRTLLLEEKSEKNVTGEKFNPGTVDKSMWKGGPDYSDEYEFPIPIVVIVLVVIGLYVLIFIGCMY